MFGDTAVAVHPEDERYRHLIGRQVRLPLTDRLIPVIADEYVEREFGSGCVKITPGHDFNDYEVGKRHALPLINILDSSAALNDEVPEGYRGLDRFVARKRALAELEAQGLIDKIEPHALKVPRGDRSGAVLEPWLTDQWYVKIAPLAEPAIKAVEDGRIRFVPDNWSKTYYQWMHNIQDWCISRQLWWGHRVPAWYDEAGNVYVARNFSDAQAEARNKRGQNVVLTQDEDVLDTWFSSALWPFSTLGWPQQTPELKTFYPTNVLVTGFDIIFFWVARMIMMGLKFTGEVPFREVYITGLIRDENGDKMSKSKGNIIDPLDLIDGIDLEALVAKRTSGMMQPHLRDRIEKATRKQFPQGIPAYGTDAVRFTFAALATMGRDIRFDLGRVEGYRNFCNKLWNAARFVLMNTEDQDCGTGGPVELSVTDRWIRARLGATVEEVRGRFADYRFDLAAQALYEFAWYEYCDWYLEFTKPVLQSDHYSDAQKRGARQTLVQVLEAYLRLAHPLMPFVTEEIWQSVARLAGRVGPTVMLQSYPVHREFPADPEADAAVAAIKAAVLAPRQIRGQLDVPQSRKVVVYKIKGDPVDDASLSASVATVNALSNAEFVLWDEDAELPPSSMAIVDGRTYKVPLEQLIDDVDAELGRIAKRKGKVAQELARCEAKLANPNFAGNAPPEVVAQERDRIAAFSSELAQLEEQAARVASLRKGTGSPL